MLGQPINELGHQYGRLTVLQRVGTKHEQALWRCHCECGNEIEVIGCSLRNGNTKSCGCLRKDCAREAAKVQLLPLARLRLIDEVDKRHGRLTVLSRAGSTSRGLAMWLCRCECGNKVVIVGTALRNGNTQSCGCLRNDKNKIAKNILPTGEAAFNALINHMKDSAKRRGYEWLLTNEQIRILTQKSCYYCGAKPTQISHGISFNGTYIYNGLDRVNNEKGYFWQNVVPCCGRCNRAKGTATQEDFLGWISQLCMFREKVLGDK